METLSSEIENSVLFLGSPLIDVIAKVSEEFIAGYDLKPDRAYVITSKTGRIFDALQKFQPDVQIGGSVTNTVRTFKKLAAVGTPLVYLGAIGRDSHGDLIKSTLANENINFEMAEISEERTGKVAVLLAGTHRTLLTDLGASRKFALEHLSPTALRHQFVYVSAFFIGVSMEVINKVIENKKTVAFNLGAPFLCQMYKEEVNFLYASSNLVFGNEAEFRALAKINEIHGEDIKHVLTVVQRISKNSQSRTLVVTRDENPVLVVSDFGEIREFNVEALDKSAVVDTNGAGDAFVGGFLAEYVSSGDVGEGVKSGISAACKVIRNFGGDFVQRLK